MFAQSRFGNQFFCQGVSGGVYPANALPKKYKLPRRVTFTVASLQNGAILDKILSKLPDRVMFLNKVRLFDFLTASPNRWHFCFPFTLWCIPFWIILMFPGWAESRIFEPALYWDLSILDEGILELAHNLAITIAVGSKCSSFEKNNFCRNSSGFIEVMMKI